MPRSIISDMLQIYRFWLVDISPLDSISLPILNPLMGFSSITAPEITSEVISIQEGNWYFQKKVTGRANVAPITLKRAASVLDRDFYNWIIHSITGESPAATSKALGAINGRLSGRLNPSPRRNLLLIQYFSHDPFGSDAERVVNITGQSNGSNSIPNRDGNSGLATNQAKDVGLFNGPLTTIKMIPARAFMLYGCIPSRYKASQDFDAKSSDVSIQELTLECEGFEQITLA